MWPGKQVGHCPVCMISVVSRMLSSYTMSVTWPLHDWARQMEHGTPGSSVKEEVRVCYLELLLCLEWTYRQDISYPRNWLVWGRGTIFLGTARPQISKHQDKKTCLCKMIYAFGLTMVPILMQEEQSNPSSHWEETFGNIDLRFTLYFLTVFRLLVLPNLGGFYEVENWPQSSRVLCPAKRAVSHNRHQRRKFLS